MVAACAAALALAGGLSACGFEKPELGTEEEPGREGLALELGGVDYNVFITRELNLKHHARQGLLQGPRGRARQGAVRRVHQGLRRRGGQAPHQRCPCGTSWSRTTRATSTTPSELPEDDAFAYQPRELSFEECLPQSGSVAQQGPTAGSMLLYEFPLQNTENRPLEMVIEGPYDLVEGKRESLHIELDI